MTQQGWHRFLPLFALCALACSQDNPPATTTPTPAATATATGTATATATATAAPATPAVSELTKLAAFRPMLPADVKEYDVWEAFQFATEAKESALLRAIGPVPPNTSAVFLADVRLIGERDLGFGRLTKETATLAHFEQAILHMSKTSVYEQRGYRPRGHRLFVNNKQCDRQALATEALAYLKEHGFEDPRSPDVDDRVTNPRRPPLANAVWEQSRKRYAVIVLRTYGKLAWLYYDGSGSAWVPVNELTPPFPEGPAPQETCSLEIGAKVKAPWSTTRTTLWPGVITELYGGMARIKFNDGSTGWAHCEREIKPR